MSTAHTVGVFLAIVAFPLLGRLSRATPIPISPIIQDPASGHRYQLLGNANWTESEAEARSLGGDLATIANQEEQTFVFNTFGNYGGVQRILWTGLNDP